VARIGLIATTEVELRDGNGSRRIPLFVPGVAKQTSDTREYPGQMLSTGNGESRTMA
jgi:hypothetical protein